MDSLCLAKAQRSHRSYTHCSNDSHPRISAFYHDSAAALVVDGEIIAAAQEDRFTRRKHDPRYPKNAVDYVLTEGGLTLDQVDYVAFYDKPFLKFERLLETYVANAPWGLRSFSMRCRFGYVKNCS